MDVKVNRLVIVINECEFRATMAVVAFKTTVHKDNNVTKRKEMVPVNDSVHSKKLTKVFYLVVYKVENTRDKTGRTVGEHISLGHTKSLLSYHQKLLVPGPHEKLVN